MEREHNQFSPELLRLMRDEEREKFLTALKEGASWGQLYQIRNTIKKLNDMIDKAETVTARKKDEPSGRDPNENGPRSYSPNG
jgi:hypothetical protein